MHHFDTHSILTDFQHAFCKKRFRESQLIITVDDLAHNLDAGLQTDLILLNLSKAFNKVPHQHLLCKLEHYGIRGPLLTWIGNFLQGRVQQVVLEGADSEKADVSLGVPQGTVMGPLCFQHAFCKKRFRESQLIITVDDLAHNLDAGLQTDLILLNLSKAFNKVPHQHLLCKLEHYGIRGPLLTWIGNFLQGRVQQVVLEGADSEKADVSLGVPQGTVMGPLCFLTFINDLPKCIEHSFQACIFADDIILYWVINFPEDAPE